MAGNFKKEYKALSNNIEITVKITVKNLIEIKIITLTSRALRQVITSVVKYVSTKCVE